MKLCPRQQPMSDASRGNLLHRFSHRRRTASAHPAIIRNPVLTFNFHLAINICNLIKLFLWSGASALAHASLGAPHGEAAGSTSRTDPQEWGCPISPRAPNPHCVLSVSTVERSPHRLPSVHGRRGGSEILPRTFPALPRCLPHPGAWGSSLGVLCTPALSPLLSLYIGAPRRRVSSPTCSGQQHAGRIISFHSPPEDDVQHSLQLR